MSFQDWLRSVGSSGPGYSNGGIASAANNGSMQAALDNASMVVPEEFRMTLDSENDTIRKLAHDLGLKLDAQTKDYLVQYYLQEKGSENAMARSREFNQNQYSDMVAGLRKAGLNPFLAISGLNGANMMQGQSTQSGLYTQAAASRRQTSANTTASILSTVLMGIALVIAHAI